MRSLGSLSEHRWLRAIRDSLMLLLPVVFVGAIAVLLGNFPYAALSPNQTVAPATRWHQVFLLVWNASHGILALSLVVLISHYLAVDARGRRIVELSPPMAAIVGLVNFFLFVRTSNPDGSLWLFGSHNVLPAILIALASTEVFILFQRLARARISPQTYDLDPSLHLALNAIVPVFATVAVFALLSQGISHLAVDPAQLVQNSVIAFNAATGSQLPGLLVLGLLNQLLWFVGIHGWNVLECIYPLLLTEPGASGSVFDITSSFLGLYAHLGGAGSTLGLLLAIHCCTGHGEARRVARYAFIPSLFNVNELLIFGLPIVFNPSYLIPFLLAPLVQTVVSYFCIRSGWVALDVALTPWTTPPLLSGVLNSGSWHGGALQLFNLLLSTLIYAPFVCMAERRRAAEDRTDMQRVLAEIEQLKRHQTNVLGRHDKIGHAARKLLHEFQQDLGSPRVYLAYQPQHDRCGAAVGVEALLRWKHRRFGHIPPAIVCALLEEAGQIIPFGRWTLTVACRQLRDWKSAGVRNLRVSINLSPLQLQDPMLLAHLQECLAANLLLASEIGLELTESQDVPDDPVSIGTLKEIEALGVHLEMDDFGMGFSSMLYLRRFKFSAIKLDGVLTREILQDKNCRDIIASVVQLGGASGIRVVAEYVETAAQQAVLSQLGCDEFQGYLYSPALAADACLDYLLDDAARRTPPTRGTDGDQNAGVNPETA